MARRRSRRQAAAEASTVEVAQWPQAVSTIDLVAEPGRVKHIHFDAGRDPVESLPPPPAEPVAESPPMDVAQNTLQAAAEPRRWGPRRKLYETDRGNKVLAEDVDGERRFIVTSPHGERTFRPEQDVDPLIAGVPLEQRRVVETVETVRPSAERSYRIVVPASEPAPAPAPAAAPDAADAWEPDGAPTLLDRSRPVRKAAKPRPARKAAARRVARPYRDFPGDDHLVLDVEGIGPVYAKRLQKQGVFTTSRLCYEGTASLARRTKVPAATVAKWKAMAELLKVKGIGPQFAEALARVGVAGIDDLKSKSPQRLAKRIRDDLASLDATVIGTGVSAKRIAGWQRAARKLRRRALPVPPKGPPKTDTVRGHIRVLPKVGARKASRKPSRT